MLESWNAQQKQMQFSTLNAPKNFQALEHTRESVDIVTPVHVMSYATFHVSLDLERFSPTLVLQDSIKDGDSYTGSQLPVAHVIW